MGMAIVPLAGSPNLPKFSYPTKASQLYTKDGILYRDTTNGYVLPVTSSAGITTNIEAIMTDATVTSASSSPVPVQATMIIPGQLYIVDCTNNTATNQLCKNHKMTDTSTVNNTSSTDTSTAGIFVAVAISGVAGDKKLIGYFVKVGAVTA